MRIQWFHAAVIAMIAAAYAVSPANAQSVQLPPVHGQFDYQLGGAYDPKPSVAIVVRDRMAPAVKGKYNICYVNSFQTQPGKDKDWWAKNHPDLLVKKDGKFVEDRKWKEYIFDTSNKDKQGKLIEIIRPWYKKCFDDGFRGIDADNFDSWTRSEKVLSEENNVEFAKLLVKEAHKAGLAIAQKNAAELAKRNAKEMGFDFAIAEECQFESECDDYTDAYKGQVYEIEYNDNKKDHQGKPVDPISFFEAACVARGNEISVIYRDRDLVPDDDEHHSKYEYKVCK